MILRKNRKRKFQKNRLRESLEPIKNPGRGWYHIYTYDLADRLPELYIACEEETVALLLIDIGHFRKELIPKDALGYLREILGFFRKNKKKMIIRPVYDTTGKGMQREPEKGQLVKEHIRQLGPVMAAYASDILVVQGILVGDWGEMHGSKFLSGVWLKELAGEFLKAMHAACYLAVRTPAQWSCIANMLDARARERLVLFNDGILGSDTDLGTFRSAGERREWLENGKKAEVMTAGPSGGEVVAYQGSSGQAQLYQENAGARKAEARQDLSDLKKMHLTYLNSTHDQKLLDQWKKERINWDGHQTSIYDYVGLHLGYRFIIREIMWKKDKFLEVNVENTGFGDIYEETECVIACGQERIILEYDARNWKSGTTSRIQIPAEIFGNYIKPAKDPCSEETEVRLHLRCKQNQSTVHFANAGAEHGVLLGTFR